MQVIDDFRTIPEGYIQFFSRVDLFNGPIAKFLWKLVCWVNSKTIKHELIHALSQPVALENSKERFFSEYPRVKVFCPIISKDFKLVDPFIRQLRLHSLNPIQKITFITRESDFKLLVELTKDISDVEVLLEENVVPESIQRELNRFDNPLKGWILQMAIKFSCVLQSDQEFNLIIDPDTILASDILWISLDGKSSLFPTYHSADINSHVYTSFHKLEIDRHRFECFVSHMMVWRKTIVEEILLRISASLPETSSISTNQYEIGLLALFQHGPEVVDWQLYGDFVSSNYPEFVVRQKWGNLAIYDPLLDSHSVSYHINRYGGKFRTLSFHTHSLTNVEAQLDNWQVP